MNELHEISKVLINSKLISKMEVIDSRIPLLKFKSSGIQVDLM